MGKRDRAIADSRRMRAGLLWLTLHQRHPAIGGHLNGIQAHQAVAIAHLNLRVGADSSSLNTSEHPPDMIHKVVFTFLQNRSIGQLHHH